jgi:hypothetical protein
MVYMACDIFRQKGYSYTSSPTCGGWIHESWLPFSPLSHDASERLDRLQIDPNPILELEITP